MKYIKNFFESRRDKFPNIKKIEIDGYFIYLGRDSKSNDHLTFNIADNFDIWMHAKGVPGSHVVIKSKDKLVTPEIIKQRFEERGWLGLGERQDLTPEEAKKIVENAL